MPTSPGRLLAAFLLAHLATATATTPDTVTVGNAAAGGSFTAPGQIHAVREAELAAQAGGRVLEVLVRSGEAVRRDQVLLRIDAPAARAAAEASSAQASAAAAQLASARADYARAEGLHAKEYVSDAALERARARLAAAEAQSTAALAEARAAREAAGWEALRAPYDGRVTWVRVAAGDLTAPGQPLVGVYAPGPMRVLADVPQGTAAELATDRPARLAYDAGTCAGAPVEATAWTLVPAVDARSRSVGVRIELPAPGGCVPGALARVSLPLRTATQSLTVPLGAVVHRGELDAVYVIGADGHVVLRQVRLGVAEGDAVDVLAGLAAGERVLRSAAAYRPAPVPQGATP